LADVIKKLAEHFQQENESAVRAKILSLFGDIGKEPGADVQVHHLCWLICSAVL
jgi:uncharacterized protein YbcI